MAPGGATPAGEMGAYFISWPLRRAATSGHEKCWRGRGVGSRYFQAGKHGANESSFRVMSRRSEAEPR